MIYFTADMHLNHSNIIKEAFGLHCRSSFSTIRAMNDCMISNWKNKISEQDTIYILGDIALGDPTIAEEIISSLPGKKILLMGNHDVPKIRKKRKSVTAPQDLGHLKYSKDLFEEIYPASELISLPYKKYTFILNHYPPNISAEIPIPKHHIYLHAHSHSPKSYNMANMALHIPVYDVGVDANDFSPISIDELFQRMLLWTKPDQIICDACGARMKVRAGTYGDFLGCSRYPLCQRIYNSIKIEY